MKKTILFIFFMSDFHVYAQNYEPYRGEGFYVSPYVGYSFGEGNGINSGAFVGYKFSNGFCLEANGAYRKLKSDMVSQALIYSAFDISVEKRTFLNAAIGAGVTFCPDKEIIPIMGVKFSIGVNVWKSVIGIYICYNSETLFIRRNFDNTNFVHGLTLGMRFLFDVEELKKE